MKRFENAKPEMLERSVPSEGCLSMMYRAMTPNTGVAESRSCTNVYKAPLNSWRHLSFRLESKHTLVVTPLSNGILEHTWPKSTRCSRLKSTCRSHSSFHDFPLFVFHELLTAMADAWRATLGGAPATQGGPKVAKHNHPSDEKCRNS